jgi:hypothetical protein
MENYLGKHCKKLSLAARAAVMKRQRFLQSSLCAKRHSSKGTNSQP